MGKSKNKRLSRVVKALFILIIFIVGCFVLIVADMAFPICFSQDYRKIPGVENIVFHKGWEDVYYKRTFWGLEMITRPEILNKKEVSMEEMEALETEICKEDEISQAIYSPDGNYILYCEIEWGARDTGLTDDEHCYYRVYNKNTGEVITVYGAYKEWYELYW